MPMPVEGILETALYADDLDAAEVFYSEVIGLERISRSGNRHVFFRCGDGVLLIFDPAATEQPTEPGQVPVPPHGTRGPGHVCFRVAGENLDVVVDHLSATGVETEADFRWPNGARSIYFRDPAGNSLECAEPGLWTLND